MTIFNILLRKQKESKGHSNTSFEVVKYTEPKNENNSANLGKG